MDSADNPKSAIPSGEVNNGKILISNQTNKFQYKTDPDCFIIDVDNFSSGTTNEISQNSRIIKMQKNFSRKGMLRGGNKMGEDHGAGDNTGESVSPTGGVVLGGSSTLEKQAAVVMGLGSREELGGGDGGGALSHDIVITTGAERLSLRRNSFKRSSQACSWYLNPRKIFLFCATLSCLGTMVLIYFAFSSGMTNVEESELDS